MSSQTELMDHPIIRAMEKRTAFTLQDILDGHAVIVPAEQPADIMDAALVESLMRDGTFDQFDADPIPAEVWPLQLSEKGEKKRDDSDPEHMHLVPDAALMVWIRGDAPRTERQRKLAWQWMKAKLPQVQQYMENSARANATNERYERAAERARETASDLIAGDTYRELTKADLTRLCRQDLEGNGFYSPRSDRILWGYIKAGGIVPEYVTHPGRRPGT